MADVAPDGGPRSEVTVRWLVAQPVLRLTVLAGAAAVDRAITFAHSIELADPAPWLRGGELLLSTGLRLPADVDGQRAYLRSIVEAGVAALGFGVGLSHDEVPPALVDEAERLGLPLLRVPLSTPFIAVVRAVSTRLAELQYQGVVHASTVLPKMTRAALRHGPAAVLRELAGALNARVAVVDEDRSVRLSAPGTGDPVELPADLELGRAESSALATPEGAITVQVVRAGRRVYGYLVVTTAAGLDPTDGLLVGHAVSLLSLELEKPLRVREEQADVNAVVLEMLLDGSLDGRRAIDRLDRAGLPVRRGLSVLELRGGPVEQLIDAVDDVLLPLRVPRVCLDRGGAVLVVLPAAPAGLAAEVTRAAADRIAPRPVHAGVAAARAHDLVEAAHRATTAADSAVSRRQPLVDAASMAGHVLIADPAARAVLARLADTLLGPLDDFDRTAGTDLIRTLRTFLDHNGHNETAAAALGVHRHTLRARVDRIREILDVDLASAHVRAELLLALSSRPN